METLIFYPTLGNLGTGQILARVYFAHQSFINPLLLKPKIDNGQKTSKEIIAKERR